MKRRLAIAAFAATAVSFAAIWQPAAATIPAPDPDTYASPLELLLSPDGSRLYVLCQEAAEVRVLNPQTGHEIATIPVGRQPRGFSFSPDATHLFVVNSWDDSVSVIDTRTTKVQATWHAGFEPSSVVEDHAGKALFIADRIGNNITVLDAATGEERQTLEAGRGAQGRAGHPRGVRQAPRDPGSAAPGALRGGQEGPRDPSTA